MKKSWALFLVSIGSLLVTLSYTTPNPVNLIVAGVSLMVVGGLIIHKQKRNQSCK